MKNLLKVFSIITLVAVIGFSFVACSDGSGGGGGGSSSGGGGSSSGGGGGTSTTSLNGLWKAGNGAQITISGNSGVTTSFPTNPPAILKDAINKGYFKIGQKEFRNLTSTGNLTWSGQILSVTANPPNYTVATGVQWVNSKFTMSANGQTLKAVYGSNITQTWTRVK